MQAKKIKFDSKGRNLLLTWLEKENMTKYRFTKTIGGNYQNVRLWLIGQTRPGYDNQLKIETLTEGFVSLLSWYDLNHAAKEPQNPKHQPNTSKNHDSTFKGKRASETRKKCA